MANGFDASSILSSYMEGANFVARGMERAEERAKAERAEKIRGFVGQYMAATTPQFDEKGQLVGRSMTDIMNSPEFKNMANDPLLQPYLSQGITDPSVKRTEFAGAVPDPSDPDNGGKAVPMLQHIGADGKPLAQPGPLTSDRSRDGTATVVPLTSNNVAGVLVKAAYALDPTLGHEVLGRMHQQSVQGFRTLYRNARTDADREGLLAEAGKNGIEPELIYSHSGAPVRVEHSNGLIETTHPGGSKTLSYSPELYNRTGGAGLRDTENLKLNIDQSQLPQKLDMRNKTAISDAETTLGIDERQLPRKLAIREATQNQDAQVNDENENRFQGSANNRQRSADNSKHETIQQLTQKDNQDIEKSVTDLDSKDPEVVAQAKQELSKHFKTPEDARTYVRGSQAETRLGDLRSGVLAGSPDDAYRNVAKELPYANKDTQLRVFTELAPLANDPDPKIRENAQAGLRAAVTAMKGPQQGKAPDPGEFNESMASSFMQSLGYKKDSPEYKATQARATEAFNRLRESLPEITKGSKAETYATIASVKAHDLAQQGMPNAEKPMFIHSELEDLGYPVQRMGSTKDFVKEIYNPLGDALTKAGVPEANDATARRIGTELVVGLKSNGVSTGIAVNEVAKLFKDPRTYVNKLQASGGDLRSLASGLAKEIKERPSALGEALGNPPRVIPRDK